MNTMIERMAKAIVKVLRPESSWEQNHQHEQEEAFNMAKAAIEAMRMPTEVMLDTSMAIINRQDCLNAYQAMIDAALKE